MTAALEAVELGKRYGSHWALRNCSLSVPQGRVVGLVGANGAGKSTLLQLAAGLLAPSGGSVRVLGSNPRGDADLLSHLGFVAQNAPLYDRVSVGDHLRFGEQLNPNWDGEAVRERLLDLGIGLQQQTGQLSGGQRAQVALGLAMGKRPDLLLLDEPVASLDPLARREFLHSLMQEVASREFTVVLSSHLLADLERVCDYLILLCDGQVRLAGDVEQLLAEHRWLVGPRRDEHRLPAAQKVIQAIHSDRQTTLLVSTIEPILDPRWQTSEVGMEDLVLSYLGLSSRLGEPRHINGMRAP